MNDLSTGKTRSDAWDAELAEDLRWKIYDTCRALPWQEAIKKLPEGVSEPSRSAWYRFLARQRKADAARRIDRIAQSVAEAQSVADRAGIKATVFVETLKSIAIDRAMSGDDKAATSLAAAAASIWTNAQREAEIDLKRRAQETRDAQLALAREKFEAAERRENAAKGALADNRLSDAERMARLKEIYGL
jgi:hypothetical protein